MQIAEPALNLPTERQPGGQPACVEEAFTGQIVHFPSSHSESAVTERGAFTSNAGDMLGLLIQAAHATHNDGSSVLLPLWAKEGVHRACALLRLLDGRVEQNPVQAVSVAAGNDLTPARALVSAYQSLAAAKANDMVPCSTLLRQMVLNLESLFASRDGIIVQTAIQRLSLPAYKRRALILVAGELMMNALAHGFHGTSRRGRIYVSLRLNNDKRACLRVADDGIGFRRGRPNTAVNIAGGLAGLLEADLTYARTAEWTTVAEIIFPFEITNPDASPSRRKRAT